MGEWINLGVGGVIAMYLIKNLFTYLRSTKNGSPNGQIGDKSMDFWRQEMRRAVQEGTEPQTISLKESLDRLHITNTKMNEGIIKLVVLAEQAQRK